MTHKDFITNFQQALNTARLAPSVHNSQPWRVAIEDDEVSITLDKDHVLHDGDPTGRESILSLGIFTEATILAALDHNIIAERLSFSGTTASFSVKWAKRSARTKYSALICKRCSDRSIYRPAELTEQQLDIIANAASDIPQTQIWARTDRVLIEKLSLLTAKAIGVALSAPSFRAELLQHLVMPWSANKRGIATASLYLRRPFTIPKLLLLHLGFGVKAESNLERRRWRSASAVILITARGDMPTYWFSAGRAYLRASLAIEQAGLSQATSAAIVEASNYHEDIEQLLGTKERILAVLRIGKGAPKRFYSPRIKVEEILH